MVRTVLVDLRRAVHRVRQVDRSRLGPVHANNGLANVPFRPQGKERGGAIAVAIATTNDAAMRAERHVPLFGKIIRGAGPQKGRSPRHTPREYVEYSLRRIPCARPFWGPAQARY
ncbi:hypothetical protein EMIT0158MI4_80050 [Burkholderia ambifaria]